MLTGLGSPVSCLVLPGSDLAWTHSSCTERMLSILLDWGKEWGGKFYDVMLHSQFCLPLSVSYKIYIVCALFNPPTPSTGRVLGLCDPTFMSGSRDLFLLLTCFHVAAQGPALLLNAGDKKKKKDFKHVTVNCRTCAKLSLWCCCLIQICVWRVIKHTKVLNFSALRSDGRLFKATFSLLSNQMPLSTSWT